MTKIDYISCEKQLYITILSSVCKLEPKIIHLKISNKKRYFHGSFVMFSSGPRIIFNFNYFIFQDKISLNSLQNKPVGKKFFSVAEIDELIAETEKQLRDN